MTDKHVMWIDHGREPKVKPNPEYPDGIDIDITDGTVKTCKVELPYPAKRIGLYLVSCKTCGTTAGITTAGQPDDPKSVRLPCKEMLQ
jgi:hypothetical protein